MKSLLKKIIPRRLIALFWHKTKAMLAAVLFGFPARSLIVIAVAGTKGKTSTAYYISHLLDVARTKNALFSTAAIKINGSETLNMLKLTTATPFFLQSFLRHALRAGCTHVVLEVSSHALAQYRTWSVPFRIVVLTNLAPDHREYHASDQEYRDLHCNLFLKHAPSHTIINGDDAYLIQCTNLPVSKTIVALASHDARLIRTHTRLPILSDFVVSNLLCAVSAARALGISEDSILRALETVRNPPGRMELVQEGQQFTVVVDYAHSVISLQNFFTAIAKTVTGRTIVVFGACGERDPLQRPAMGSALDKSADIIIVTNDDPYGEDPSAIATMVAEGVKKKKPNETLFTILDRKKAIAHALALARAGDCVCILGKGAEQWQIFKNKKISWDDRAIAKEILSACKNRANN